MSGVEWRGQSMGSGAGAVAKPAAGVRGSKRGLFSNYFAVLRLEFFFIFLISHQLVTEYEL